MKEKTGNEPAVYVGTYRKYNSASLRGAWVLLTEFPTKSDFYDHIQRLHADEDDPEYMFQDFENFPKCFYGESYLDDRLWLWLDLDDNDRNTVRLYLEHVDDSADIETATENARGKYDSKEDFSRELLEETGGLEQIPENLQYYFDYDAYARDLETNGDFHFIEDGVSVYVFSGN